MGMRIHSVMRGWAEFNTDDPKKLEATIEDNPPGHAGGEVVWGG